MDPIIVFILLTVAAIVLFSLEIFVPSAGLLGIASALCLLAAIVMLFRVSSTAGLVGVIASAVIVPAAIAIALKVFPATPIGRKAIISNSHTAMGKDLLYDVARDHDPQSLVGLEGLTVTTCRPVGFCQFNDKRIECLSIDGTLDPGVRVRVISVNGIEVKIRAV